MGGEGEEEKCRGVTFGALLCHPEQRLHPVFSLLSVQPWVVQTSPGTCGGTCSVYQKDTNDPCLQSGILVPPHRWSNKGSGTEEVPMPLFLTDLVLLWNNYGPSKPWQGRQQVGQSFPGFPDIVVLPVTVTL